MKKTLMILAASAFVFGMSSCKKDWTCTCTTTDSVTGISASASTTINDTKSNAEDACEGTGASAGTITTTCSID